MQNHKYLFTRSVILVIGLKKKMIIFNFFPIVKMTAKYAKLDRVGSLDANI